MPDGNAGQVANDGTQIIVIDVFHNFISKLVTIIAKLKQKCKT